MKHFNTELDVAHEDAVEVETYPELVRHVAEAAHQNPRAILLFRGQAADYRNKGGGSTFYPTIYRGASLRRADVSERFSRLEAAEVALVELFDPSDSEYRDLKRRQLIRWSILQHYEVCPTPLLDFTHSLHVACSFALQDRDNNARAYVFCFAFPYLTGRITQDSEDDLVVVRLLSISPPSALRPYFQEGYLSGTTDITTEYDDKTEFDFNRRLVAKFSIPTTNQFWDRDIGPVPRDLLMPEHDEFRDRISGLREQSIQDSATGMIGEFLLVWQQIEAALMHGALIIDETPRTVARATELLAKRERIHWSVAAEIDALRRFRNQVVHNFDAKTESELLAWTKSAREVLEHLKGRDLTDGVAF